MCAYLYILPEISAHHLEFKLDVWAALLSDYRITILGKENSTR